MSEATRVMLTGMSRPMNPGKSPAGDFCMRSWMLITLCVGCGQMYQAPGGQPPPAGATVAAGGDPYGPGQGPSSRKPDDPYADQAAPQPAHQAPAELAARRSPARSDRSAPNGEGTSRGEPARTPPAAPSEAQALVDAHNRVRAKHCAGPLAWSPKLAQVAQQWANSLRDQGCAFGHSKGSYGENLAAGSTGLLDPESVVKMWYDEVAQYKFPNGGFSMKTGHFTQVVWRATTHVGCGHSQCKGMDIWVCEYDPAGNWEGQYRDNVLPLGCH